MRVQWLIIFIFLQSANNVNCSEGFVTIFSPNVVYEKRTYSVVVVPTDIDGRNEIALNFRSAYGTVTLANDVIQKVKVTNTKSSGAKPKFDLTVTIHRNMTTPSGIVPKCITRTIQEIEAIKKMYYTFIQIDKPIYKPGDLVQFRIVVVDRDMKPFHFNNINVLISDPLSRTIKEFVDPDEMYIGVFTNNFTLSSSTPLGIWTVRVIIDGQNEYETNKRFAVEKYTLPPFSVHISTEEQHFSTNAKIPFSFYAMYSYGNYVNGNAKLTIRDAQNNHVYLSKSYENIVDIYSVGLNVRDDLRIITDRKLELEATVVFTEPESGISSNAKTKLYIHVDQRMKIRPVHPQKFKPGLPFHIKVFTLDWREKEVLKHHEKVSIKYFYEFQDGSTRMDNVDEVVRGGVAMHEFIVPDKVTTLEIKIGFVNAEYSQPIPMGETTIEVGKIVVEHYPKYPKANQNITIYARSDTEIDQIVVLIMSRHGHVESHKKNCDFKLLCTVGTRISNDMMPHATVIVYQIKNKHIIFRGESTIETADISTNELDVDVPKSAKTRDLIKMRFKSKSGSKVYLLAYDKRLTYLRTGNDIKKEDVVESLAGYDTYNKIEIIPLDRWNDCTYDDYERLRRGRQLVEQHSGDYYNAHENTDLIENLEAYIPQQRRTIRNENTEDDLRDYFPETWIFEEFQMSRTSETKSFMVPDSITSWMIYAFAMNKEKGLAIAPTKELIVKNEFFMKIQLPYSIRFKEILRLDILVYNYIEAKHNLDVTVILHNLEGEEFQFVDFNGCNKNFQSDESRTQSVMVPYNKVKRVSFWIRSNVNNSTYEQRIKVIAEATGNIVGSRTRDKTYRDEIGKFLRVEPIGVKKYELQSQSQKVVQEKWKLEYHANSSLTVVEYDEAHPKFMVSISSDYLSDSFNISKKFEIYPSDCLEQRTSRIKGNLEYYQYMKSKNRTLVKKDYFSNHFQSLLRQRDEHIWRYGDRSGYRAYFVETIGAAMNMSALPMEVNMIEAELDELKRQQSSNVKNITRKSYADVIAKSFSFLDERSNMLKSGKEGLSMAAYAYALHHKIYTASMLLNEVEKEYIQISNTKKCFKLIPNGPCNTEHSSYAAMAYIKIGEKSKAINIFNWLIQQHNENKYEFYTHTYAIATEAIAKMTKLLKHADTNFEVVLKNEASFEKRIRITDENIQDVIEVEYPEYSRTAYITTSGKGFCSITVITEKTITINETDTKFKINVTPLNETLFRVCAVYDPGEDSNSAEILNNVIYDIEMPSGHIFSEIIDIEKNREIKMGLPKQKNKRVQIFYNEFKKMKNYCVDIKSNKLSEVKNMEQVGVMVYDYDDKKNVAIEFYKPSSDECYSPHLITTTKATTTNRYMTRQWRRARYTRPSTTTQPAKTTTEDDY